MRSMMRASVLSMLCGLAACRSNQPLHPGAIVEAHPDAAEDPGAAPPVMPSGGGPVNGDPSTMIVVAADAAAETAPSPPPPPPMVDAASSPEAAPPLDAPVAESGPAETGAAADAGGAEAAVLLSCPELAAGGEPDRLTDFQWMIQTSFSQAYYDTVTIDGGCKMTYVHIVMGPPGMPVHTSTRNVTMAAADCAAARGWTTNARFLEVLRTGENCPAGPGNPGDVFDLTLTDEGRVARKTYLCPEPTVEAVRACLRPLIARLFPM
jgi:hypothetical protein